MYHRRELKDVGRREGWRDKRKEEGKSIRLNIKLTKRATKSRKEKWNEDGIYELWRDKKQRKIKQNRKGEQKQ